MYLDRVISPAELAIYFRPFIGVTLASYSSICILTQLTPLSPKKNTLDLLKKMLGQKLQNILTNGDFIVIWLVASTHHEKYLKFFPKFRGENETYLNPPPGDLPSVKIRKNPLKSHPSPIKRQKSSSDHLHVFFVHHSIRRLRMTFFCTLGPWSLGMILGGLHASRRLSPSLKPFSKFTPEDHRFLPGAFN